jgi:hypothetical protein
MRKIVLAALAALASIAPAYAGQYYEYDCMRDGPGSRSCEWSQFQNERQNERNREMMERSREAQCQMFHNCR